MASLTTWQCIKSGFELIEMLDQQRPVGLRSLFRVGASTATPGRSAALAPAPRPSMPSGPAPAAPHAVVVSRAATQHVAAPPLDAVFLGGRIFKYVPADEDEQALSQAWCGLFLAQTLALTAGTQYPAANIREEMRNDTDVRYAGPIALFGLTRATQVAASRLYRQGLLTGLQPATAATVLTRLPL